MLKIIFNKIIKFFCFLWNTLTSFVRGINKISPTKISSNHDCDTSQPLNKEEKKKIADIWIKRMEKDKPKKIFTNKTNFPISLEKENKRHEQILRDWRS